MKAKLCLLALAGVMLAGCGGNNATTSVLSGDTSTRSIPAWSNPFAGIGTEEVELLVWAGETQESIDFVKNAAAEFKRDNPQSNYTIKTAGVSESSVSGDWAKDKDKAADVAICADDQIPTMISSNYIQDLDQLSKKVIPGLVDNVKSRNSKESIEAVTGPDGKIYGFPVSGTNGFILYYNTNILKASDLGSFDSMLAAIKAASERDGKNYRFGFPSTSGWYLDGWFHGAGFNATGEPGEIKVDCNWNASVEGVNGKDVAGSLVKLAQGQYKSYWTSAAQNLIMTQVNEGPSQIVATINGTWNYKRLEKAWNGKVGASILPTFHLDEANKDVRMQSPRGFKVAVVNKARAKTVVAAAKFAEYLTNFASQIHRFDMVSEGPTNTESSKAVDPSTNPCIDALLKQYEAGAFVEKVNDSFWNPTNGLADQLLNGSTKTNETNLVKSGVGTADIVLDYDAIQGALDACVRNLNPQD